ncbi:DUF721 domain-containing protein [Streptomyces nitrosporeus]|uniref:DUF721 domain-containing protein n=1 Tax=Streptomyces nitrosporeus TaxID=28894 RepID=UPI0019B2E32C|nr:DUF721 domain-containing protein [Streptomyces nitrosporeus]GGZ19552.1 hypothetical protein GCM10010327_58310 [Streptomyces nitrosporeus]
MSTEPELSGVDLAGQALLAAREAARKNGATSRKPKRRPAGTVVRRDGREPLGLGNAISRMMTERGMTAPAAGGSVLAGFDTILATVAPELAGRARAVGFDAYTGRLDVAPDAPAYGTKVRWIAPKLITAANEAIPEANRPGRARSGAHLPHHYHDDVLGGRLRTGTAASRSGRAGEDTETASAGYRRALAAHHAVATPHQEAPALATAVARQEQVRRDLAERAFPDVEQDQEDKPPPSLDKVRDQQRRAAEVVRMTAIRRVRVERIEQGVRQGIPLGRTA